MAKLTAVFGGTFDPVHRGHVEPLIALLDSGTVDEAIVVPALQPVHRGGAQVGAEHRLAMLRLAYAKDNRVRVSEIELSTQRPSYTVWTLRALKQAEPENHFCFVVGADWSVGFENWYRAWELPSLAHLIVMNRPGAGENVSAHKYFDQTSNSNELRGKNSGLRYAFEGPELDLSSTAVRDRLVQNGSELWLSNALPSEVFDYIKINNLYQ